MCAFLSMYGVMEKETLTEETIRCERSHGVSVYGGTENGRVEMKMVSGGFSMVFRVISLLLAWVYIGIKGGFEKKFG